MAGHALEATIAVGLILSFFLALQVFLNMVFPSDGGLGAMIAGMRSFDTNGSSFPGDHALHSDGLGTEGMVARLTATRNEVKSRRGNSLAWGAARPGLELRNRDAVQTMNGSSASITFSSSGLLSLGSNTHVIISSNDSDIFSRRKRPSVLMVDGELRGRLISRAGEPVALEVTLPGGKTSISAGERSKDQTEFQIMVNEDSSAAVRVESGSVEVVANGDTVQVNSSEFTTLSTESAPSPPSTLDEPVQVTGPESGKVFNFRNLSPRVEFEWDEEPRFSKYRVLISTDPEFENIVHDEILEESRFTHGNLSAGTYYWRVLGVKDGFAVTVNNTQVIHLTQSTDPPRLTVEFPKGVVEASFFDLKGRTEPGTRVLVGGGEAKTDARGYFMHRLNLDPGLNVIVVEAIDRMGNVAYKSQVVNSKP
jgi:hypothetical protein